MLSYHLRWVPIAALILVYLTQSTHAAAISLLDLMPKCASECIESFISSEYPRNACSTGCDLNYLCTENTASGYTLGEAALRCSLSLCSTEVAMSFDTYSICDSVPGALPRTHPTIVATITSPANPTSVTTEPTTMVTTQSKATNTRSTTDPTSTDSTPTEPDHTATTTKPKSSTSTTDSTPDSSSTETDKPTSTTSTDSSPSATSDETTDAPSQRSSLNSGAVIGVSVASGIAGFFIIGVIIIFCCRKLRRKAQDREFFEIGGHMSEPPDFSFPPKRPLMGPRPSPGALNTDSESARLVPPVDAEYQRPAPYPAVIVTQPEEDCNYSRMPANTTDRSGVQSSNLDLDAASTVSSRTVSDLLPDKPAYELYPRPLRWSQHKKSRPSSRVTLFDEGSHMGFRKLPSPPLQQSSFTPGSERSQNRVPMAGLPANPRAMMYGFGGPGRTTPVKGSGHGKRPAYSNAKENLQPSPQPAMHGTSPYRPGQVDYDDDLDNYWQNSDTGFVGAKVIQPQSVARGSGTNRNSLDDYPGYDFEFGFGNNNIGLDPRRASRHSGGFRPLTPVREIRTPLGEAPNPVDESSKTGSRLMRYGPRPPSAPSAQSQEITSRPRIVRQDDIKRVEIRRGKSSPKEATAPYCPDDYWLEQSNEAFSAYYGAPINSGEYNKHITKGMLSMPKKKPSPLERNLTPSRRGADLILQVE
ncbi:hypothetical protein BJX76DRAFT_291028 [Aspergillus varians]